MSKFILCYCAYDPDNYRGHRMHSLNATDLAAAKVESRAFLDDLWVKALLEFRIIELAGHDSGSRLWDTRDNPNKAERDYTINKYWETD